MSTRAKRTRNLLDGTRVYLSGPMDFVASREEEMKNGWRTRISVFLRAHGCVVFNPWDKPGVRGLDEYGREGKNTAKVRNTWTFEDNRRGAKHRSKLTGKYWETLHIDLRMVDTSDFTIAYCPTNIYSVGTPHEIALCRQQRKPVLFVSPPIEFPALEELRKHLFDRKDQTALSMLSELESQVPIKPNPKGIPSLWYMPLVGSENFFDGFGFDTYHRKFKWQSDGPLDIREKKYKPKRPLLPFLMKLTRKLPEKWDNRRNAYVRNDDWLLWDLHRRKDGADVASAYGVPKSHKGSK